MTFKRSESGFGYAGKGNARRIRAHSAQIHPISPRRSGRERIIIEKKLVEGREARIASGDFLRLASSKVFGISDAGN
jgi:hypothetical protein